MAKQVVATFVAFFVALGLFLLLGGKFSLTALLLIGLVLTVGNVVWAVIHRNRTRRPRPSS